MRGGVILIKSKASRAQILRAVLYQHTVAPAGALLVPLWQLGPLSIQPKRSENFGWYVKWTDHFGLVRPEYSGPALKVVHFDHSGLFGRPDRNVPFHLRKLLSPVPFFFVLLTRTITKQNVPFHWACGISNFQIFVEWRAPYALFLEYSLDILQTTHLKVWIQLCLNHYTFLGNCPPTPPLSQHFALSEK